MSDESATVHLLSMSLDLISDPPAPADAQLLRDYVHSSSGEAFATLVHRYADLVYSAARRQVRDPHLAEDVAQAVFILLSQRAGTIRDPARLVGWLYQTTHFTATNAKKLQRRRQHHEQAFAAQEQTMTVDPHHDDWSEIAPVLDQAMAELDRHSRDLLLIRYFQGKSVQEVASTAGLSLYAAQKRLSRSLEKLRVSLSSKGVALPLAAVASALLARSVHAAPPAFCQSLLAASGSKITASTTATEIARQAAQWNTAYLLKLIAASVAACALIASLWVTLTLTRHSPAAQAQSPSVAPAPPVAAVTANDDQASRAAVSMWDQTQSGGPIQKPWPLALAGSIAASPITADLFGDGKTEIIVPSMAMTTGRAAPLFKPVHPHPTPAALVYAFYLDGTSVPGFPVELVSVQTRLIGQKKNGRWSEWWSSSPSIVKINGKDVIVISGPDLTNQWDRALFIIRGDASVQTLRVGSWKPDSVPPVAIKLQPDGPTELLGSYAEIDGNTFLQSVMQSHMKSGYDVCIGDAHNDGKLEFFQTQPKPDEFTSWNGVVFGFDQSGRVLPGWPQPCAGNSGLSVVMGDLLGDGQMEIAMPDDHGHLLAWTADGKPFGSTYPEDPQKAKQDEAKAGHPIREIPKRELPTSILAEGFPFAGPLSLADLDGEGRAEIVFYCTDHTLRAFRGNGHGFDSPDGILAKLPEDTRGAGVAIANLDADNSTDFFLGTLWIHRKSDNSTTITRMLSTATNRRTTPTITNLNNETVILNTTDDGRVFIYHTNKPYHPDRIQWSTIDGNPNHTACWHSMTAIP